MKNVIIIMMIVWMDTVFAASETCALVNDIVARGENIYEITDLSYFSKSELVFYKENVTTGKDTKFSLTPILFSGGKQYLMDLQWDHENIGVNSMPEIDTVALMDFNKNGLNELVFIAKREGYLGEYGTVGYVMDALVVPDEQTLLQEHGCVIKAYPYISEHLSAIRTAKIDGKDTCAEKFCNTKQVMKEIVRIQNLSGVEFLGEAHALALSSFKSKMTEMAAKISDAALIYPSLLSEGTVNIFNDMGFFKEQAKHYDEAVAILGPVSVKFPNRTVVFLNLGDAYSGLKKMAEARASYTRYVELMKSDGKEKKIPKRISSLLSDKE